MKLKKIIVPILIAVTLLLVDQVSLGIPADPDPISLTQPDLSVFQARFVGDEREAHFETLDGFTIIKDEKDWWNFASMDERGNLVSTGQRVGKNDPKKTGLEKHLHMSSSIIELIPAENAIMGPGSEPSRISQPVQLHRAGDKKVLVILINFTDVSQKAGNNPSYYDDLLFNVSEDANSMYNYYKEVSYNKMAITGDIAGNMWFQASNNEAWYGKDCNNPDSGTCIDFNETPDDLNDRYIFKLAKEAVRAADPFVDYSLYDTDNDRIIDDLIIIHAGNGQESSQVPSDIWSHRWEIFDWDGIKWNLGISTDDNVKAVSYTMQAESSPLGTFAHEFGHNLGLLDLYDTNNSTGGAGYWDIMGYGAWLNEGNTPSHFSAWSKYFLGWVNPVKVKSLLNEQINTSETYDDIYLLLDNPGDSPGNLDWNEGGIGTGEYFLVENRRKIGFDAYLPGEGLLIWHIDETRRNNNDESHKLVDLEEADGKNDLDMNSNRGDATDPWNNSAVGFTEDSAPNSSFYSGVPSGVRVTNISVSSSVMTANLMPPPMIVFFPPTPFNNSFRTVNWIDINVTSDVTLIDPNLEWNGTNESASGPGRNWSINKTSLSDGVYTFRFQGNDRVNNWNVTETRVVSVDTSPPVVLTNITAARYGDTFSIMNNSFVNIQNATMAGKVTDQFGIDCVLFDHFTHDNETSQDLSGGCGTGEELKEISFEVPVTLQEGVNKLILSSSDVAGNSWNVSFNVTRDTILPEVRDLSLSTLTPEINKPVNITTEVSDLHLSRVMVSVNSPGSTLTKPMVHLENGNYLFLFSNTSDYGRYNVTINASDEAGNINNTVKTWFVTTTSHSAEVFIHGSGIAEIASGPMLWNSKNFPGLVINEELNVQDLDIPERRINRSGLFYNTTAQAKKLNVVNGLNLSTNEEMRVKGLKLAEPGKAFDRGQYFMTGWQGERFVALNGKVDKLAKLVLEQNDTAKNLAANESWNIGEGWSLRLNSTDTTKIPAQAELVLSKDGIKKAGKIVSSGTQDAKPIFTYVENNMSGEKDVPVFVTCAANIAKDKVQLKYTWLMSTSIQKITKNDTFGVLKDAVIDYSNRTVSLKNRDEKISLSPDTAIPLMDTLSFRVTGNSSFLEYYPFFFSLSPAHIDATENADTAIDIITNSSVEGIIKIAKMGNIPPGINGSFDLLPMGTYFLVNASENIKNDLDWMELKFYYQNTELLASGLDENSLGIAWYNKSDFRWENLAKGSPYWVSDAGVSTADDNSYSGHVWVKVSHLGTYFAIVGRYPSPGIQNSPSGSGGGSSSSGGGGGGGTSGENFTNILLKEKYDEAIYNDRTTSYWFRDARNPVMFVNITGNVNAGLITATTEVLRGTSTLLKEPAPGVVYQNFNLWVGTSGFATSRNIKEATIMFRVENSWTRSNGLNEIKLVSWDSSKWTVLETSERMKDSAYIYLEAETKGFSHFAITGTKAVQATAPSIVATSQPEPIAATPGTTEVTEVPDEMMTVDLMLITEVFAVLAIVIGIFLWRRK